MPIGSFVIGWVLFSFVVISGRRLLPGKLEQVEARVQRPGSVGLFSYLTKVLHRTTWALIEQETTIRFEMLKAKRLGDGFVRA